MSPTASAPAAAPAALVWATRAGVLAHAALLAVEFATAGRLVAQDLTALPLHSGGAVALHAAAGAQLVAALLLWRPGGGPPLPAVLSAVAFVLGLGQAYLGSRLLLSLHVPLAMVLVALVTWTLVLVWRPQRARPA